MSEKPTAEERAAQCWCQPGTSDRVMDAELCKAVASAIREAENDALERAAGVAKNIARECDRPGGDYACSNPSATAAYEVEKAIRALKEKTK